MPSTTSRAPRSAASAKTKSSQSGKIAYQGEAGANSHIACGEVYPDLEPMPCPTFEDALAGEATDQDAVRIAAAMAEAQRAYGALDCTVATAAAKAGIGIGAARQAAGLAVPELARAWTYVLLCADRGRATVRRRRWPVPTGSRRRIRPASAR